MGLKHVWPFRWFDERRQLREQALRDLDRTTRALEQLSARLARAIERTQYVGQVNPSVQTRKTRPHPQGELRPRSVDASEHHS